MQARDAGRKSRAYGLADRAQAVPATTETLYQIESLTKPFTAAAILQLAKRNRLRLDDDITRYFPDFPAGWRHLTVRPC